MTAPLLLAYITAALLLQLAVGIVVSVRSSTPREPDAAALPARVQQAAWRGVRQFRVSARKFEDPSHTQCSFTLAPVDGAALPPFRPGQFLTFAVRLVEPSLDGTVSGDDAVDVVQRSYSMSDLPRADSYRVTIKRALPPAAPPLHPAGVVSAYFHDQVQVGTVLDVRAPSGQFAIDPDATVPVVLIAGGIGITPMLSMLLWCAAEQPQRDVTLFYGVRCSADHAFKSELEQLAAVHPSFHLHVLYGVPAEPDVLGRDYAQAGFMSVEFIQRHVATGRHQYYVCGPPVMMELLVPGLAAAGVPSADIHFEAFGPASVRRVPVADNGNAVHVDVQFRESGRTLTWDGSAATVLDFAESNGIAIESGCRSGSCGSCETKLVSGTVQYATPPEYDVTRGFCLPCVCVPQTDLVLDA